MTGTFFDSDKVMAVMVDVMQRETDVVLSQEVENAKTRVAMAERYIDVET